MIGNDAIPLINQHVHGGSPGEAFDRLEIPHRRVVDFSVNVSPLGPPQIVLDHWQEFSQELSKYPTINGAGVTDFYTRRFQLKKDTVLPGNGSTECIYLVPRALNMKRVAIMTPSFHDYQRACQLTHTEVVEIPLSSQNGFLAPEYDKFAGIMETVDGLMLGNPNNPTNTLIPPKMILRLADQFSNNYFMIDEAFSQFVNNFESQTLLNSDPIRKNILIFHSLTKFYDLPGIRLGAVISHAETIARLKQHKEPWTINGIAEKIAPLLAESRDYEQQLTDEIHQEREHFFKTLGDLDGLTLFPSHTNFILAQWTASENLDDLLRVLLTNGYHVRDCRNFKGLENNFFRFAILGKEDNTHLIQLLTDAQKGDYP